MTTSTVTRKGQATIPKEIRDALGLHEGDRVIFVLRGEEIVLKVLRGNILELRGSVKATKRPENFEKVREMTKREVVAKVARDG
ncbi:MAG TPA: AbrB/MazE/SpoVT family DNA-binding domain-containing protein [Vicinamibacteria bacterium]|nr:AbrB/MazE/SpoVT family DNA-binding domain-containing protein [Vicinamibacteria bacterium]